MKYNTSSTSVQELLQIIFRLFFLFWLSKVGFMGITLCRAKISSVIFQNLFQTNSYEFDALFLAGVFIFRKVRKNVQKTAEWIVFQCNGWIYCWKFSVFISQNLDYDFYWMLYFQGIDDTLQNPTAKKQKIKRMWAY